MIRLGCCCFNFVGMDFESSVKLAANMGFGEVGIGIGPRHGSIMPDEIWKEPVKIGKKIRETCEAEGVKPVEFFVTSVPLADGERISTNDPDPNKRAMMLEAFRRICDCAANAGFHHVMGSPGGVVPELGEKGSYELAVDMLGQMAAITDEYGVGFTIEPGPGGVCGTPERIIDLVKAVPGLQLTLDHSHFVGAGVHLESLFQLHPYASYMHAKPSRKGTRKCPFSESENYYVPIFEDLRRIQWDGVIAAECIYPMDAPSLEMNPIVQTSLLTERLERTLKSVITA